MHRRAFVTLLGGAAAIALSSPDVRAQADRVHRIGWLEQGHPDDPAIRARIAAVRDELERLGWAVGRNLQLDIRYGMVSVETGKQLGGELLALSPDVILCAGSPGVKALQQATSTVSHRLHPGRRTRRLRLCAKPVASRR
jgi:putative ABC transport system substrate-binding protein